MSVKLDLIVPGLMDLPVDVIDRSFLLNELPALNQILSYSKPVSNPHHDLESILSDCMGWPEHQKLPLAQTLVDQESTERDQVVLFRPVHLKPDMYNAIVTPIADNSNNIQHIVKIINDLGEYFKVDCDIRGLPENDWLMQLKGIEPPRYHPHYLSIFGRKADPYIEQSRHRLPWYKLMNEMQMFMHQHRVNQDRQQADLPAINSLWFWGAGSPLKPSDKNIDWYCEDELLVRFARNIGLEVNDIDQLETEKFTRDGIVIDLSIVKALKIDPQADLPMLLSRIEKTICSPLLAAVRQQHCKLRLRAGYHFDYQLSSLSRLKWWRKGENLVSIGENRDMTE